MIDDVNFFLCKCFPNFIQPFLLDEHGLLMRLGCEFYRKVASIFIFRYFIEPMKPLELKEI